MNQQISQDPLENLLTSSLVKIEQHLEPLEIVTGFETRNRFSIIGNNFVLFGREDSPVISRMFVPNWRAFTFNISDGEGSVWLSLRKPFDILFAKVVVSDRYGQPIGLVRTRLSIIAKRRCAPGAGARAARHIPAIRLRGEKASVAVESGRPG